MKEFTSFKSFKPGDGFPSGVVYKLSEEDTNQLITVSAPVYIENTLDWIEKQLDDATKFPPQTSSSCRDDRNESESCSSADNADIEQERIRNANQQTQNFAILCGQIYRRIFRVYGIIYTTFKGHMKMLDLTRHVDTCYKHFCFFLFEFNLLPNREFMEVPALKLMLKPIYEEYKSSNSKACRQISTQEIMVTKRAHQRYNSVTTSSLFASKRTTTTMKVLNANAA